MIRIFTSIIIFFVVTFFFWSFYKIYHQNQKPIIICKECNGQGSLVKDVNLMMLDATLAIYMNHHIMTEKCKDCIDVNGVYLYCDKAQEKISEFQEKYEAQGAKLEECECFDCSGMGKFHARDIDAKIFLTSEEYYDDSKRSVEIIWIK